MSDKRYTGNIITDNPTDPTANSGANYGVANGVWSLAEAKTFSAAGKWPVPASVPSAPTIGTASAGNATATVPFTANSNGGLDVTSFIATSNPGSITGSASSSPITVTGLSNGTAYTFTVTATNVVGTSAASSASNSVSPVNPPRGIFFGGGSTKYNNSQLNTIDYITISSTGNAQDFGDLSVTRTQLGSFASTTRAVSNGGIASGIKKDTIDYVTIASTGNAQDFGDISTAREGTGGLSNATRGVCLGGDPGPSDSERVIEYVTIASTGNTTDFGDSAIDLEYGPAGCASPTRGIIFGGSYVPNNTIQYITIGSTGNASDFGDLNFNATAAGAASSETRALCSRAYSSAGGQSPIIQIDYITIASTGDATDFGDQGNERGGGAGTSSNTRGIFAGGDDDNSGIINVIEYVTIASTGNTQDFGDLTVARVRHGAASSDHGGLQ